MPFRNLTIGYDYECEPLGGGLIRRAKAFSPTVSGLAVTPFLRCCAAYRRAPPVRWGRRERTHSIRCSRAHVNRRSVPADDPVGDETTRRGDRAWRRGEERIWTRQQATRETVTSLYDDNTG